MNHVESQIILQKIDTQMWALDEIKVLINTKDCESAKHLIEALQKDLTYLTDYVKENTES